METKYLHVQDGSPVRPGICMMPDHYLTTFSVTVRSMLPVNAQTIKDLIQTKYEATDASKTKETCYVANSPIVP